MNITILCSDTSHPINSWLLNFCETNHTDHSLDIVRKKSEMAGGDVLFLVSCHEILRAEDRKDFKYVFVLHASDVPRGRGWSPHVWQILEGKSEIVVTLLEADDEVDTGQIWGQIKVFIPRSALYDEINNEIFRAEIQLMQSILDSLDEISPKQQSSEIEPSYFPKRTPEDSELDVKKSIEEQFDLLRVSDPDRYPAFFKLHGETFKLVVERYSDDK